METGLIVGYSNSDPDVFRRIAPDRVELVWADDGRSVRDILNHGVFWSVTQTLDANGRPTAAPGLRMADPPFGAEDVPGPNTVWRARIKTMWTADDIEKTQLTYTWGSEETRTFGSCTVSVIPAQAVETGTSQGTFRQSFIYLPDYGITIVTGYAFEDEAMTPLTPISLTAVQ